MEATRIIAYHFGAGCSSRNIAESRLGVRVCVSTNCTTLSYRAASIESVAIGVALPKLAGTPDGCRCRPRRGSRLHDRKRTNGHDASIADLKDHHAGVEDSTWVDNSSNPAVWASTNAGSS